MQLRLDLQHKRFDTAPIARLFTQGENNIDVITLRGAKMYGALDASQLTFIIRAVSEKDTLVEQQLMAATDGDDLVLTWTVTADFTAVSGMLYLKLRGIDTAGNVVLKLGAEPIYINADIQGDYAPPQDVLTKALDDMRGQVAEAEVQAGIAKTEADRLVQTGVNFKVMGFYSTLEELQTAVPNPARGDAYGVGDNPVHVYAWSGTEWQQGQELGIDLTAYYTKIEVDNIINNPPAWYIQSNPNLLINADFRNPINQRGKTLYTDKNYTIDRWVIINNAGDGLEVTPSGVIFKKGITDVGQRFEHKIFRANRVYTLSISINGIVYSLTFKITSEEPQTTAVFEKIGTSGMRALITTQWYGTDVVFLQNISGADIKIEWVKLELGDHATPFIPRLYGEELALCQRYYETSYPNDVELTSSTGTLDRAFWFSVKKRATPTVSIKSINGTPNKISIHLNGSWQDCDYTEFEARTGWYRIRATQQQDLFNVFAWNWTADAEL